MVFFTMKGIFISFEGTEGSGKSTQSKMLAAFLKKKGFKVQRIWDPGSTQLGESVRDILLTPGKKCYAASEMLLYMAARAQLVDEKIIPAVQKGVIVICDRFADATVAYQGYGLGVNRALIDKLNLFVTHRRMPDITFFLDADIKKGLKRCHNVKGYSDRIERRSIAFHRRVRNGYLSQAKRCPGRVHKILIEKNNIDATQDIIRRKVLDVVSKHSR